MGNREGVHVNSDMEGHSFVCDLAGLPFSQFNESEHKRGILEKVSRQVFSFDSL